MLPAHRSPAPFHLAPTDTDHPAAEARDERASAALQAPDPRPLPRFQPLSRPRTLKPVRMPDLSPLDRVPRFERLASTRSDSSGYESTEDPDSPSQPRRDERPEPTRSGPCRIRTNPRYRPLVSPPTASVVPPPPSRRALLAQTFDRSMTALQQHVDARPESLCAPGGSAAPVIVELHNWSFDDPSGWLPMERCSHRLQVSLALLTAEGRHPARSVRLQDGDASSRALPLELPPRELLERSRVARDRLSMVIHIHQDRVHNAESFADSLKAFAHTTIAVDGTVQGRLPHGCATAHVHRLDLTRLTDGGIDLRRDIAAFGQDLRQMPHLRRVRAPEGWSGDKEFRAACQRAQADIDWVSSDNLVVGKTRPNPLSRLARWLGGSRT